LSYFFFQSLQLKPAKHNWFTPLQTPYTTSSEKKRISTIQWPFSSLVLLYFTESGSSWG
jgi:hypothetical protein